MLIWRLSGSCVKDDANDFDDSVDPGRHPGGFPGLLLEGGSVPELAADEYLASVGGWLGGALSGGGFREVWAIGRIGPKSCHRPGGKREVAELVGVGRPDRAPVRGAPVRVYGVGVGGDDQGVGMKVPGGKIVGITNNLAYIAELGCTAIWLSPIFENNNAYHGYDINNYLSIDPRFGTKQVLIDLVDSEERGIR